MPCRLSFSWRLLGLCIATGLSLLTPEALAGRPGATPADQLHLLPGFKAELLYSVPRDEQGSWVSLTTDDHGRLIASDQSGPLYRITPPRLGGSAADTKVERLSVEIGSAQGLLYAFGSLYVNVNGRDSGLYRVRDTNGDDQFDEVTLLRRWAGGGEHGPHALRLSPDGKSIYVACGNHTDPPEFDKSLVPRNWQEDHLLPRMWDAGGHAVGRMAPGGWIVRTDPDGKALELVSIGYRNEYDLAFSPDGELFTFDADMEWDIGAPWYRPTRVNHVTSGSEFGWRSGTGKWPDFYPDSLGSVVDIGPGSPTGITFGTGARFPAKYQQALYLCDWSYGQMYAVHMQADGASYSGAYEIFVAGSPLPVTDVVVQPNDGALYFTIGGRGTQSGLYRVTYVGTESTAAAVSPPQTGTQTAARALRQRLEALHREVGPSAVEQAWPHLSHADRSIRYAARIAVEHQPVASWQERALGEKNAHALTTAIIALARNGDQSLQPRAVEVLSKLDWSHLTVPARLDLLRAYGLVFTRWGSPNESVRQTALAALDPYYPAEDVRLNRELCQVLIYLKAPDVIARTLHLLATAATQEEEIHYIFCLRVLDQDWTIEQRRAYFQWFARGAAHQGGHSFAGFLRNIRNEAIERLKDDEKSALAELLQEVPAVEPLATGTPRELVQKWTVDALLPSADRESNGGDLDRGRKVFSEALCFKCHRFAGEGGIAGPDLTGVARRFNNRNMLESLLEPSKVVSDQYLPTQFVLNNGQVVIGRIVNAGPDGFSVLTDMLKPDVTVRVPQDEVDEAQPSRTSQMPNGLLDTFTEAEILDLMAYLRSGSAARPNPQPAGSR